jgi:hypothetical protein
MPMLSSPLVFDYLKMATPAAYRKRMGLPD